MNLLRFNTNAFPVESLMHPTHGHHQATPAASFLDMLIRRKVVSIGIGLWISSFGEIWQLYLGHGLFVGVLGTAGLNAPLYVYVSHWFDRRRGSSLALLSSGLYLAGTVWPPIFERAIATFGWKTTMVASS